MKNFFFRFYFFFYKVLYKFIEKKSVYLENNNFNRISLINFGIFKLGPNCRYLEIGVFQDTVFNSIPLTLDKKIGVDPVKGGTHRMTSDEFFKINKIIANRIIIITFKSTKCKAASKRHSYNSTIIARIVGCIC